MTRLVALLTGGGPWKASVDGGTPRELIAAPTDLGLLPVPPDGSRLSAQDLAAALDRLDGHRAKPGDAKAVGRHLLSCLVDDTTAANWRTSSEDIHLAVTTDVDAGALQRLPWELLHDGKRFLAIRARPAVILSRSVGDPEAPARAVEIEPVLLVVIGGSLENPILQPAAEYLALLDTLRRGRFALNVHLLVNATRDDVRAMCAELKPDVVHMITHGSQDAAGTGYIELNPSKGTVPDAIVAEQLISLLEAGGRSPEVVVLTACRTAGNAANASIEDPFTFQPSFAAACVAGGVPLVAAMTGAIASRACREFTFGFYASLVAGGDVVAAAAAGRRTAFVGGKAPGRAVDWAYPAVFCGPGVDGTVTIKGAPQLIARGVRASELLERHRSPRAFCGRHDVLHAFGRLLNPTDKIVNAVLALRVPADVASSIKVGASRTLAQLGASGTLSGYVVADAGVVPGNDRAGDLKALAQRIVYTADAAACAHGATAPPTYQLQLLSAAGAGALDVRLNRLLDLGGAPPDSDEAVALALRLDLAAIDQAVRAAPTPALGLIVILDDLHLYGPAVASLLNHAVTSNGLGTAENPVRFVFSFGAVEDTAGSGAVQALADFAQTGRVQPIDLKPFTPPAAWLAYRQLLLGHEEPLVPVSGKQGVDALEFIHESCHGNPDLFDKDKVVVAISAGKRFGALELATDSARLLHLTGQDEA